MNDSSSGSTEQYEPVHPAYGTIVQTACGGTATFGPKTPWAIYHGKVIYFCLSACRADFDRNPETSCLAARLGEFKK
jgi:hypothetical protein